MKKIMTIMITIILLSSSLSACADRSVTGESVEHNNRLQIVTTIFPEYDWMINVLGDNPAGAEVSILLDDGVDLHSFQPSADDIMKISTCDMFIYVGGESDAWVDDALKEAVNDDMIVINMIETLGDSAKPEEMIEGMQSEDHDHGDEGSQGEHEHDNSGEEAEFDEHVWLSLKNAGILVNCFAESMMAKDPDNAEVYRSNAETYVRALNELDEEYRKTVNESKFKTLLFGDRFPFRYLLDDYGLDYFAAFVGCSAETEASFETVTFLAHKLDELGLPAVITIEGSDAKIAETIVNNTTKKDQKILLLDSMQSTTSADVQSGSNYLSIMEKNLITLKEALN